METVIILVDMKCSITELQWKWELHLGKIENVHILLDEVKAIPSWCVACRDAVPGFYHQSWGDVMKWTMNETSFVFAINEMIRYLLCWTFLVISCPKRSCWLLQGSSSTIRLKPRPNCSASTFLDLRYFQKPTKELQNQCWIITRNVCPSFSAFNSLTLS